MENYKILLDHEQFEMFNNWLPELNDNETFYCCLFARSKYTKDIISLPHIRSDKAQLKRFTSNKDRLLSKIKQLECPIGAYKQKEIEVPQQALALYISINPRCFIKATKKSLHKLVDLITQPYNGFHPYQEVMSEIQKAKSKSRFVSFDFDVDKNFFYEIYNKIDFINLDSLSVVETRGGFHFIVRVDKVNILYTKNWYTKMSDLLNNYSSDKDNKGDIMLPIVGTYQGGLCVKFKVIDGLKLF